MNYFKLCFFFAVIGLVILGFSLSFGGERIYYGASLFFAEKTTNEQIRNVYKQEGVKVLIVPGHEEDYGGAEYKNVKERDLNYALANELHDFLSREKGIVVYNVKNRNGKFQKWFTDYKIEHKNEIERFRKESKTKFKEAINDGFEIKTNVVHNTAPGVTAFNLYAVNKYANDNDIDIVIHIHFNDNPRNNTRLPGKYNGFAIYAPEDQLPNSKVSLALAEVVKNRLQSFVAKSDYLPEKEGIVKSQSLIAVGSNASRDSASILIEYAYIYEPQVVSSDIRPLFLKELAFQTYLGIRDYLKWDKDDSLWPMGYTITLPYNFNKPIGRSSYPSKDTFALQIALHKAGFYPPDGKSLNDCSLSGIFGPCTERAVYLFQEKHAEELLYPIGLKRATGSISEAMLPRLDYLYSR